MEQTIKIPTWYWVVAIIMLLWNLLGVSAFFMQIGMSEEAMAALPETERELYASYPLWATIAYAVAVFGGALGCIGLLLKKKWAKMVLIISLIGIIIQVFHSLAISGAMEVYGPGAAVMPTMIIVLAIFLVWLSNFSIKKHWLT
ncbi:hypothetical protein KZP23_05875 [Echinicola marina]|uniref:hypothetical protein n=1 Tax=Echinicola marina TaxID=2859768 RepID=UPI001CF60DEF|nr:hypothetical protein [Echinicola marina]UCS94548.1 hypothetical protein KZP23_05875 [Echinicola marina]